MAEEEDRASVGFRIATLSQELRRMMRLQQDELHEWLDRIVNRTPPNDEERRRGDGGPRPNRIGGIKLNVPPFKGKSDPEVYLEWELKIEHVFSCNTYNEKE
jgi:hypothetical protein